MAKVLRRALLLAFGASACLLGCSTSHGDGSALRDRRAADSDANDASVDGLRGDASDGDRGASSRDAGYELVGTEGCVREPIAEGLAISPGLICAPSPTDPTVPVCSTQGAIECLRHSDCSERPRGYCEAGTSSQCNYPRMGSTCNVDSDCAELPEGVCVPPLTTQRFCDADGSNCLPFEPTCHYRILNQGCTRDDECGAAPGGFCDRKVWLTRCVYFDCEANADCSAGERCVCHTCVPAECHEDSDCGAGQACQQGNPCGFGRAGGFYCTKSGDECRTDEDCPGGYCDYDPAGSRFLCSDQWCSVP